MRADTPLMELATPPPGFRFAPATLMANIPMLPCDVFLLSRGRAVLFAGFGAETAGLVRRMDYGVPLLVREEDEDLLAKALVAAIPGVLKSYRMGPEARSRIAYDLATTTMKPMLSFGARPSPNDLLLSHDVVDAISEALVGDDQLVGAMVATMEKHPATYIQAINCAVYSVLLARRVGVPAGSVLRDIGRGALLHDIGKVRVPNQILDKPGPLDDREWEIMQRHPSTGCDLVQAAVGGEATYLHILRDHHERADGSGYPEGRRGSQVAIDSQMVAITDAFVALTSVRPYSPPTSAADALHTMRHVMRGQFHDGLLKEFIALLAAWHDLRRHELGALLSALQA